MEPDMMQMGDTQQPYRNTYEATQPQNNATIMQLRLSPDMIIEGLQQTLSGVTTEIGVDADGNPVLQPVEVSTPLVNKKGFHRLMQKVRSVINTQTVQGNWKDEEMYFDFIACFREELAEEMTANIIIWEIDESDYDYIINVIMDTLKWYATRSFDDKERQSYSMYKEIHTNQEGRPKLKLW